MKRIFTGMILITMMLAGTALARVDLVTLPGRDTVQLTIYNSADLTLVREQRLLTLKKGVNHLQFSWANTLIDPTSLDLLPKTNVQNIDIVDLTYPPRVQNLGLWHIQSQVSGKVPVEISYLTSGLSWRAFYLGTLSTDEKTMHLKGYVRVSNNSGEDYENAQTRLIVGNIHILDDIAELAQRDYPYGRPRPEILSDEVRRVKMAKMAMMEVEEPQGFAPEAPRVKEIKKEGLSEYFLYTIEGRDTIPHGWSKRLPSFETAGVPVVNLYRYEEDRFRKTVVRFLKFKNDTSHKLGVTPIPDGVLKVFRSMDAAQHLAYEGQSRFKYIPVDQEAELDLGEVNNVIVNSEIMKYETDNYLFYKNGDISGWDEIQTFKITAKNTRDVPVKVEILRNFPSSSWEIASNGDYGKYEKVDMDTVKYTLELKEKSSKEFTYVLRIHLGTRAEGK